MSHIKMVKGMKTANFKNLVVLAVVCAVFGIWIGWGSATDALRHFIGAGFFYTVGVVVCLYCLATRGSLTWRGVPASLASQIVFVFAFFIWGAVELSSGLGWRFIADYGDAIDFTTLGLLILLSLCDRVIHYRDY